MNHSVKTRFLAMFLAIVMVIGYVPTAAFANETEQESATPETTAVVEESTQEASEEESEEAAEEKSEEASEEESEEATEEESEEVTEEESEETDEVEPVKYTVNYYKWNWDAEDYVLLETEELTGIPGEQTNAQAKEFESLILEDEIQQAEIAADGSTVVAVYYIQPMEEQITFVESPLYDTSVSSDYFKVLSADTYTLANGAQEHEIILNNAAGSDRKVVHVFEVDTKEESLLVMPGYYGIDKLDPDNLALDGIADKSKFWKAEQLTKTVKYYENMGYNVVGAMNTALAYDSDAPYGYMVWNGVVLGTPEVHKGAQTYLAIDKDGTCELRSMSTPLTGNEQTAISANFNWLVKDGKLTTTKVERDSSDASRSMIGIKEDGTLIFCQVDGRNAPTSTGLSNYEMGEAMLALGCVNAVNCDGGGSSTFVSKRAGESENIMRSVPSDGSERPTINSVILATNAGATGKFATALIEADYGYIAPGAHMAFRVTGLDTNNYTMEIPADVTYQVAEEGMGKVENGVFTAGNTLGTATIQASYNDQVVGVLKLNVVHPDKFFFAADETVIPYGKSIVLSVETSYGDDSRPVCVDGAYTIALSDDSAATLDGNKLTATSDETVEGIDITVIYTPDPSKKDVLKAEFGKGSEILLDFEDGDLAGFMGFKDAKQWSIENGVNNSLVGSAPLGGQFSEQVDSYTSISSAANGGKVKNGSYALAWSVDNTDGGFAGWTYNVLFNVGERIVFRDTANGMNATTLGMWLYIPEGAAGLAFQSQFYGVKTDPKTGVVSRGCYQDHFMFNTVSGARKNLNSCTEADIPANRWVYASIDISGYDYLSTMEPYETASNGRSPSFIRTYVKPMAPAVHTFYIDDITLDYSSAVDDRVAPVIEKMEYSSADTSVSLKEGTEIQAKEAAFSAKVADEGSLNLETAQIYMDGNKVETQVANGVMSTKTAVAMENGAHTVTFEIADDLGNYTQQSVSFIVNYSEEKSLVYVDGHNDSGKMPEYDSVYYVDIKTSDISKVQKVEANIKLNNANNWELEHLVVAEGFSVDAVVFEADNTVTTYAARRDIHSTDNVAVITITRTGDCTLTGEQTLVSLPVRLWSWNGFDQVTGKPVTPEEQFKSGYCPVVTVDYNVLQGYVETIGEEVIPFNGSGSVETMINDIVNPWHYHDEVLTVQNQAATCTVNGYENRTYCETCKSVVDWGTKLEAPGHTHAVVGDQLKCHCGHVLGGNGLVHVNDKVYVLIADKLVTGWQNVDGKWVYAEKTSKEVQIGEITVNKLTYTTDENGFIVKGAWVTDANGSKYSYGPKFYTREWADIDGKTYYFHTDSYMFTGIRSIPVNRNNEKEGTKWYEFQEDGIFVRELSDYTGFLVENGTKYYVIDGMTSYGNMGVYQIDGDFYYLAYTGYVYTDRTMYLTNNHGLLPAGNYTFDEEGRIVNIKNGICVDEEDGILYYYENSWKTYGGLMLIDGDYYYAKSSGEVISGRSYWVTKTNDLLPEKEYTFDADGKMVNPPVVDPDAPVIPEEKKEGIVKEADGKLYYYENGKLAYGGLMLIDGDYYYAKSSGEVISGRSYWVTKTNDLLPEKKYTFGEDGKMVNPPVVDPDAPVIPEEKKEGIVKEADGKLYYYENGKLAYGGLMQINGDYYYATSAGEIICNRSYWISKTNNLLPEKKYTFGEDGKMVNPPVVNPEEPAPETPKNGLYTDAEGNMFYYENGKLAYGGLILIDGDYYYANSAGEIVRNKNYWITKTNDLLPAKKYTFGADGKMVNPPV